MKTIIFSGPTLSQTDRNLFPQFDFRPPIADGDILRLSPDLPDVIGIIDGYFGDRLSIFHKEILWGLARGIRIFGAASMGALRAAELDSFGMIGVGGIYRRYRAGDLTRDDVVAVCHGPEDLDYVNTSIAWVDIEATLAALVTRGEIQPHQKDALMRVADDLHFSQRTWEALEAGALRISPDISGIASHLAASHVQLKRLDALEMLAEIHELPAMKAASVPRYRPPITPAFKALLLRGLDRPQ